MPITYDGTVVGSGNGSWDGDQSVGTSAANFASGGGLDYSSLEGSSDPFAPVILLRSARLAELPNQSDPVEARLSSNGLVVGGGTPAPPPTKITSSTNANDWRVKISVASGLLYNSASSGVMAPLQSTNGVIFPYTPSITVAHAATYSPQKFTHSNYSAQAYENSEVQAITITGDFTVQNVTEGAYLLACIYFFRAATKMFFGSSNHAGNPPPMVFLDGYGSHYFPHVPCVITQFQHTLSPDVDYIAIPVDSDFTRLPVTSSVSLTLQPVYSKNNIAKFNLDDFAAGKLVKGGFI